MNKLSFVSVVAAVLCVVSPALCVAPPPPTVSSDRTHPDAGKFTAQRDPDKPVLAFYGGIGLRQMPDGTWNGYDQQSSANLHYLISRMRENGMTRVYASFQEEQYPSKVIPREKKGTDFVAEFITRAHQNNIEVYGDIACFGNIEATCKPLTDAHPEMFTRDVNGVLDSHMLSPAYAEVRDYKRRLIREYYEQYPIDGIALDFIRYPYYGSDLRQGFGKHGYDAPALKVFRERFGYDEKHQPAIDDPRWIRVKTEFISQFIREVREDMTAAGLSLPIATFNSTHYGARDSLRTVHQDWQAWEEQKLVDEHAPMLLMTLGMTNLTRSQQDLLKLRRPGSKVMGAIFLDAGFQPDRGFVPTPELVKDAARRLIKQGCDGLWFCRASEIEQWNLWPTIKEISGWSISKIRDEEFDPYEENLFTADAWTSKLADQVPLQLPVILNLNESAPVSYSRSVQFSTVPYLCVDSLQVDATLESPSGAAAKGSKIELKLQYADGITQIVSKTFEGNSPSMIFKIEGDFDRHVLQSADASIILQPGSGTVKLTRFALSRDPLLRK